MNILVTILFFIFLINFTSSYAQYFEGNGELKLQLYGNDTSRTRQNKVSEIKIFSYRSATDTLKGNSELVLHEKFDRKGRLIYLKGCIHENSDPCAEKVDKRFYYNEGGKLYADVSYNLLNGNKFYDSINYKYLPNGKIIEADGFYYNLTTYDDSLLNIVQFVYDSANKLKENYLIGHTREQYKRISYERDNNGNITKYTWYDDNKKPAESGQISYDAKGREISRQEFDDKSLSCKIICRFDKSGNCVERRCFDGKSSQTLLVEYKYDGKGRLVDKYEEEPEKVLGTVTKYKYDNAGRLTEIEQALANKKKLFSYLYKYDEKGNLIQEDFYDEVGELAQIYKYKYQYYK